MFFIDIIRIAVPLLVLLFGSYTDIKQRIIPNYLTYGLFLTGIGVCSVEGVLNNSIVPILNTGEGIITALLFGGVLYKVGVWAGGDFKLLLGIGAINPTVPLTKILLIKTSIDNLPIFPITFVVYSIIAIIPYVFGLSIWKTIQRKDIRKIPIEQVYKNKVNILSAAAVITATLVSLSYFGQNTLWVIPIVLIVERIIYPLKNTHKYWLSVALIIISIIMLQYKAIMQFIYMLAWITLIPIVWGYVKIIRTKILREDISTLDVKEGMIPADYLILSADKIQAIPVKIIPNIENIKERGLSAIFNRPKGKQIGDPHCAEGFSEKEAELLKEFAKKGKAPQTITVKKTIAFIPTLTIGYTLAIIFGNAIWSFI